MTEDGWLLTSDAAAVLDHTGDLLLNEDEDERDENLALLGAREGKEAALHGRTVFLTDLPVHQTDSQALADLRENGEALCWHTSHFTTVKLPKGRGEWQTFSPWSDEDKKLAEKWRGVVAKREDFFVRLVHDEQLWEECEKQKEKERRKEHNARLRRCPRKDEFWSVAVACAAALGLPYPKGFRVGEFLVFVQCHDALRGRRATNKLLRVVAKQWCGDREGSKKWLVRWVGGDVVEATDKRLAAVLRLGDRNSWLDKRGG